MNIRAVYDELIKGARQAALLTSCEALLEWDELTYMPTGGVENRGEQMAFLAGLAHHMATDPRTGYLLAELESTPTGGITDDEQVNVRRLRRAYDRLVRVPRDLVEHIARTATVAQQHWLLARQTDDFSHFKGWLQTMLDLKRHEGEYLAGGGNVYDALLDSYEPELRQDDLEKLFAALRHELISLAERIVSSPHQGDSSILAREYPLDRQRIFGEALSQAVGFDFQRGRLDTTAHPFFSPIGPGDCRITTRYAEHRFAEALFATLHELGHALYEQGLDPRHYGTPLGESSTLAIHESQSRLWENNVGRGRPFWEHFFPLAQQVFHDSLHGVTLDEFHRALNHVRPSHNRVQADEVTYNLHILIRFELERDLLAGDLSVADLPAAWNEQYARHLGLEPAGPAEGCLQDSHWAAGLFGYFPAYTLGNVFAAQLMAQARGELGDLDAQLARGEFGGLLHWLRTRIHRHGQRYTAVELIERATGAPPDHRAFVTMLKNKYETLYEL